MTHGEIPKMNQAIAVSMAGLCLTGCAVAAEAITNPPPQAIWERDTLTGDWGGLRPRLAAAGVDFSPVYTGEVFNDAAGGEFGPGTVYDQSLNLPLTLDLEKLAGWPSATVHANAFWIAGQSLSENHVGDISNVSNISADPALRLQELWVQQNGWHDAVSLKAGLLAADNEFFTSPTAALFINGAFGAFPLVGANLPNPPIYPMAAPAVRLLVQPAPDWYFQTAIYDGDSGTQAGNPSGTDCRISTSDGALIFSEIGFLSSPAPGTNQLAGSFKARTFIHTKRVPTWAAQTAGSTGGGQFNAGVYAIAEHDLFRRAEKRITAFVRGGYAPADCNVVDWYLDAGLSFVGLVPRRPADLAGLAFSRSNFSRDYSRYEQSVNGTAPLDAELVIEASYRAQITPWWTLQPDLQFVCTPGGNPECQDAVIFGLRTTLSF